MWIIWPLALGLCWQPVGPAPAQSLFDGQSWQGWDNDRPDLWRIEEGCIVGGSLTQKIPHNYFLATQDRYANFILRLEFKLLGDVSKGFVNSGVQIRSERVPNSTEMIGYQCDLGDPAWWGCLYDESRRNKVLAPSNMEAIQRVLKRNDWNRYEIRAEGVRIRTYINGVLAMDYTEPDQDIPQQGRIGLQIHSGGPAEAWFRRITIERLPDSPPLKKFIGAAVPPKPSKASPLDPGEQRATFSLPPGFDIELVASEPDVGKPITVAWDHAGRLWTMTALEYPVDANENPERSRALFRDGGRDRVLIFDQPERPGPLQPRTFADKLAIPLGLLPYRDGALVQYGDHVLRLHDPEGKGQASKLEPILTGFGTEDSHLFVHQFTRGPGGWIYLAQGAFNHSKVRDASGQVVTMNFCKMARFKPDGRSFELVQAGLNNIWGFVINRQGEMFIQEANDLGYPVVPFSVGANYPGIGMEKLKPYAPWEPSLGNHFQMGGTGLSGLALAEDRDGWPEPYADVMYVANPITRKIQAIRIHRDGSEVYLQKLPDFLLSADEWFRPVAIHFGPDGCLYIVDWYNKIISHNEVPRNHPERDKTRGRIWRIRHQDQPRRAVPDLTRVAEAELPGHLASPNTWEARSAWHEIVDRRAVSLKPTLTALAMDAAQPVDLRLRALWCLEELHLLEADAVSRLLADPNRHVRRETVRALSSLSFPEAQAIRWLTPLADDADHAVRAEVIRALSRIANPSADALGLLIHLGKAALEGDWMRLQQGGVVAKVGAAHHRDFERYLVRSALERHPVELARLLGDPKAESWPLDNRLLAALALKPSESVAHLAKLLPRLQRDPNEEELLRLFEFAHQAEVQAMLPHYLRRRTVAELLLNLKGRLPKAAMQKALLPTAQSLWSADEEGRRLAIRLTQAFQLQEMEPILALALEPAAKPDLMVPLLRALRELKSPRADLFHRLIKAHAANPALREEALLTLVASSSEQTPALLVDLLADLNARERRLSVDQMVNSAAGARAILEAVRQEALPEEFLDAAWIEKMQIILGDHPELQKLLNARPDRFRSVLILDGRDASHVEQPIDLEGPFTVETWIRLEEGITNADSILGAKGSFDCNFHDAKLRIWTGPGLGDVLIAKKPILPLTWTHVAITRDERGYFAIYLNGELDNHRGRPFKDPIRGVKIGWSNPPRGTRAALCEYRVWNRCRTAAEIRDHFDHRLAGSPRPEGLMHYFAGDDWGKLNGSARLARTTDFPALLSDEEMQALQKKFTHYRGLQRQTGDSGRGRAVFEKNCMNCHSVQGAGGQIGPTLSGAGAMGEETLLRSLLTPSAAIEPGYRLFRIMFKNGTIKEGYLVRQDNDVIVLRREGSEDETIPHGDVEFAGFIKRSVMPDALLDALPQQDVVDLFQYLKTLK